MLIHRLSVFLVLLASGMLSAAAEVRIADFSAGDLSGWKEKSFNGHTRYRIVELNPGSQVHALRAHADAAASGLYRKVRVDLTRTPFLHWSWRVENLFSGNDERSRSGDDYPARVYVVVSGGMFFWKTRAVDYVWSSQQPKGSEWPNAYTPNARMIAVQAGPENLGRWVSERRNVLEDFRRAFGEDIAQIDAVAIMVDADDTGQSATTLFGDIWFSDQ